MPEPTTLICHRCAYASPEGATERQCPKDGLHLVEAAEHEKASRDIFLGTTIGGKYPILGILGHGGMGAVYRSIQPHVEREVAVKLVLPSQSEDNEQANQRFLREAKAIARLTHPAIVTLHDFGVEEDDTAFMVMELVRGRSMSKLLRKGELGPSRLIAFCFEVLEALQAAHAEGMIHRDLKPENIMVLDRPSGRYNIKVLDFGLAKVSGSSSGGPQLTKTGMIFGTPQYMAPEQALGESADASTDLYALGVILYQGLAGHLPFDSDQALALLQAHVAQSVPPLPEEVDKGLSDVVMRALAKRQQDRYESAAAMAAALRSAWSQADVSECETLAADPDSGELMVARSLGEADTMAASGLIAAAENETVEGVERLSSAPTLSRLMQPEAPSSTEAGESPSLHSLRDAAGELNTLEAAGLPGAGRRGKLPVWAALGGAALVVLVLSVWALDGRWASEGVADGALESGAVKAASQGSAESAPSGPEAPAASVTRVHILTSPEGASVYLGKEKLGLTPVDLQPEGAPGGSLEYRLESVGYRSERLEVVLDGKEQSHRLRLVKAKPKARRATKAKAKAKAPRRSTARPSVGLKVGDLELQVEDKGLRSTRPKKKVRSKSKRKGPAQPAKLALPPVL